MERIKMYKKKEGKEENERIHHGEYLGSTKQNNISQSMVLQSLNHQDDPSNTQAGAGAHSPPQKTHTPPSHPSTTT